MLHLSFLRHGFNRFLTAVLLVASVSLVSGCGAPGEARNNSAPQPDKKVPSITTANFDKVVLNSEVPVLIWFCNNRSSGYDWQLAEMASVSDHYAGSVKVVKVEYTVSPEIKWTMYPQDPEPWSTYNGANGVWLLRFPDGKTAALNVVRGQTNRNYGPTADQIQWFVDHAAAVAPLTTGGGTTGGAANNR